MAGGTPTAASTACCPAWTLSAAPCTPCTCSGTPWCLCPSPGTAQAQGPGFGVKILGWGRGFRHPLVPPPKPRYSASPPIPKCTCRSIHARTSGELGPVCCLQVLRKRSVVAACKVLPSACGGQGLGRLGLRDSFQVPIMGSGTGCGSCWKSDVSSGHARPAHCMLERPALAHCVGLQGREELGLLRAPGPAAVLLLHAALLTHPPV